MRNLHKKKKNLILKEKSPRLHVFDTNTVKQSFLNIIMLIYIYSLKVFSVTFGCFICILAVAVHVRGLFYFYF